MFKIPGKNKQKTASIPIKEQLLFKMIYKKDTIEDMLQFLYRNNCYHDDDLIGKFNLIGFNSYKGTIVI